MSGDAHLAFAPKWLERRGFSGSSPAVDAICRLLAETEKVERDFLDHLRREQPTIDERPFPVDWANDLAFGVWACAHRDRFGLLAERYVDRASKRWVDSILVEHGFKREEFSLVTLVLEMWHMRDDDPVVTSRDWSGIVFHAFEEWVRWRRTDGHPRRAEPREWKPMPPTRNGSGCAYFVQNQVTRNIKIGCTAADEPEARVASLQTSTDAKLILLGYEPGGMKRERELHERFRVHHVRGEWFRPVPDLLDYLRSLPQKRCDPLPPVGAQRSPVADQPDLFPLEKP